MVPRQREERMSSRMSRREALKLGTNAAVSAAMTPLLSAKSVEAGPPATNIPDASPDICFMRAVDMAELMRQKKLSAREVMQAHLKQINRVNPKVNAVVTHVSEGECGVVQREKAAGAMGSGKTNVREFGLGSQTLNPVFGPTRNPYDVTK